MLVHVVVQEHGEKASLDNPGGEELMAQWGGKDAGLPFFAFLDSHGTAMVTSMRPNAGKPASANIGYPAQPEEIAWFLQMLEKVVPGMPTGESSVIEQWLKKNNH
ncbi:MAG TPA: hypothetical protein VME43_29715 [Bryobacteraceae bacterium]|nr:hypothetical protein [Bryobacteraceae bacterium]